MISAGRAAFEAWKDRLTGPFLFDWEDLEPSARKAWEDIAQEAVRAHAELNG